MDEVVAIWNSTAEKLKAFVPRFGWDMAKSAEAEKVSSCCKHCPSKSLSTSPSRFSFKSGGDMPTFDRFVLQGSPFVRLAGLSGAAAVALGAYGAHAFDPEKPELKKIYDTANFYHFVHSLALLAVPLSRRPYLSGMMMIGGMSVFCGTIYYQALTEDRSSRKYTPYGGVMLIIGWLALVL